MKRPNSRSVGFGPVLPAGHVDLQGHGQVPDPFHLPAHQGLGRLELLGRNLEDDFVMHGKQHGGLHAIFPQGAIYMDHGQLDQIRGRSLDRGVDGGAFGKLAHGTIAAGDVGQLPDAAKQGAGLVGLVGRLDGAVDKCLDALVAGKIVIDIGLRHLVADIQFPGQTKGAHAVDDAEIDCLGLAAQLVGDHLGEHLEYLGGRAGVDILVLLEGLDENRILRTVGQDAQFDLGVIRREQLPAATRNEGLADFAPLFGADGDILQVGIAAAQPAGGRHGLVEGGVDAARFRMDQLQEGVGIGRFQFGQGAMAQDQGRQFMAAGQGREDFHVGGVAGLLLGFLLHRQFEFLEENGTQLLGGVDIEGLSGQGMDVAFQLLQLPGKGFGQLVQLVPVHADTRHFHFQQYRHKGHLHRVHELGQSVRFQLRDEHFIGRQGDVGILAGVGNRLFNEDLVEGDRVFAFPGNLFVADVFVAEVVQGNLIQAMGAFARIEQVRGDHRVESHTGQVHVVAA
ncbi:hypothetical protein DESC_710019 [Desulfosarcina cetonica]|nr:hypothetical protein DESC_710019 [Desulfosarcina cetonica]